MRRAYYSDKISNFHQRSNEEILGKLAQGMVIVVPSGDPEDPTRNKDFYDPIFDYLRGIGFTVI